MLPEVEVALELRHDAVLVRLRTVELRADLGHPLPAGGEVKLRVQARRSTKHSYGLSVMLPEIVPRSMF